VLACGQGCRRGLRRNRLGSRQAWVAPLPLLPLPRVPLSGLALTLPGEAQAPSGASPALASRQGLATVAAETIVGTSQKDRIAHMRGSRPPRQAESLTQRAQLSPVSSVTMTLATGHLIEDSPPGVTFTVLFDDQITKRRSILLRALPGATFESHAHSQGFEECLVLEGDLVLGDLRLGPGDYHVATMGTSHPLARTVSGCLCFQTMPL
jgi:hypothetical protein